MTEREQDLLALEVVPRTAMGRLLSRAEEWIYDLNARQHPIFRLYDAVNAAWARICFRGVRRRAEAFTSHGRSKAGVEGTLRWIGPQHAGALAQLFAGVDFRYRPPHALDPASLRRVLEAPHSVPFGLYAGDELIGYSLLRLFFPRRAVMGIWVLPDARTRGLGQVLGYTTTRWTASEGLPNFITVPRDNMPSLHGALVCGWRVLRTNRRFHVLLHDGHPNAPPGSAIECRYADGRVEQEQGPPREG